MGTVRTGLLDTTTVVPHELEHELFHAVPLTTEVADLDHAAYVASPDVITLHSDGRWPVAGFTARDNLSLVAQHQADHESNRAFTFTLLAPARAEALGCLYLNPLDDYLLRMDADPQLLARFPQSAMVTFWLRRDQQETGLADAVAGAVDDWLRDQWPIESWLFRVLPAERSSREALEHLDLRRVDLSPPGETRPYLWFRSGA